MNQTRFREFISSLHNAYGKRTPTQEVMDFLWGKAGNLPESSLDWIEERFLSINEKFPTKLHPAILGCWYDWRRHHPDKVVGDKREHTCRNSNCINGVLCLQRYEERYGTTTEYSANCGDCKWINDQPNIPTLTMFEAHQRGFDKVDFEARPEKYGGGLFQNVVENWRETSRKIQVDEDRVKDEAA